MKVARIYIRVSTDSQDLTRQEKLIADAKEQGFYVASVYREKASGARADRPELLRMIDEIQEGEVIIAEKMDRISRLPLDEAEALISQIKSKGARLAIPDLVDLSELADSSEGIAKIVIDAVQAMLLKITLQYARDEYMSRRDRQKQGIAIAKKHNKYKGRQADQLKHQNIIALREAGKTISETAKLNNCSLSLVKSVWREHKTAQSQMPEQQLTVFSELRRNECTADD